MKSIYSRLDVSRSIPYTIATWQTPNRPLVLMSLGATLKLVSSQGERLVSIEEIYRNDGEFNHQRERNELLTEIFIRLFDEIFESIGLIELDPNRENLEIFNHVLIIFSA